MPLPHIDEPLCYLWFCLLWRNLLQQACVHQQLLSSRPCSSVILLVGHDCVPNFVSVCSHPVSSDQRTLNNADDSAIVKIVNSQCPCFVVVVRDNTLCEEASRW